jgi:hypothetical protein
VEVRGGGRLTRSHPKRSHFPGPSMSTITWAAFSDQGRWAPTRAHAIPSRMRYLARVWISCGMSEMLMESTQRHSFPVGPLGSIGKLEVVEAMLSRWKLGDVN